jgi:transcriptional regulator with XRE-family HTH domain
MIGEEVRRRREALGLTGAQLAAKAGMAPSAVSQIETGKRTPSSTSVLKLAYALGVEVGELYPKGQGSLPELEETPALDGPFVSDAFSVGEGDRVQGTIYGTGPVKRLEEAQCEAIYDLALTAARNQAKQDIQAANRALESGRAQAYFMRHENEAMHRLLEYPADELAAAVLELARRCIELEGALYQARAAVNEQYAEEARRGSA